MSPKPPATSQRAVSPDSMERRERKRKHDRDAQRISRERQKARVKELEDTIRTLQAANERPERISELLAQVQNARDENLRLRDKMRKAAECLGVEGEIKSNEAIIEKIMLPDTAHNGLGSCSLPPMEKPRINLDYAEFHSVDDNTVFDLPHVDADIPPFDYEIGESHDPVSLVDDSPATPFTSSVLAKLRTEDELSIGDPISNMAAMILRNPQLQGKFWLLAGAILDSILGMAESMITPRALDDDIVIRCCVEGWEVVQRMYWLDAGWRWLRQLDEHMYSHLNVTSRMAMLRTMRLQYLVQRQPSRAKELDVPNFLVPRPAQQKVKHEKLIEHFVWPGMREHLLFSRDRYATNRFMEPFRKSIRFAWPHDPQDAYEIQPTTELYGFTPLYLHHQSQIGCWQIHFDFFELFPELRNEMPSFGAVPCRLLPSGIAFTSHDVEEFDDFEHSAVASMALQHSVAPESTSTSVF